MDFFQLGPIRLDDICLFGIELYYRMTFRYLKVLYFPIWFRAVFSIQTEFRHLNMPMSSHFAISVLTYLVCFLVCSHLLSSLRLSSPYLHHALLS